MGINQGLVREIKTIKTTNKIYSVKVSKTKGCKYLQLVKYAFHNHLQTIEYESTQSRIKTNRSL